MKTTLATFFLFAFFLLAPNLIWLKNSTSRVLNKDKDTISSVTVHVNEKQTEIGDLLPGESRFIFLPKLGDATYKVTYDDETNSRTICVDYVESEMYHMETVIRSPKISECNSSLPLLSELFIFKVI